MTPKITNIHTGEPVALRITPAKNTPAAGPSCAPDCTNAEKRPRLLVGPKRELPVLSRTIKQVRGACLAARRDRVAAGQVQHERVQPPRAWPRLRIATDVTRIHRVGNLDQRALHGMAPVGR